MVVITHSPAKNLVRHAAHEVCSLLTRGVVGKDEGGTGDVSVKVGDVVAATVLDAAAAAGRGNTAAADAVVSSANMLWPRVS